MKINFISKKEKVKLEGSTSFLLQNKNITLKFNSVEGN